MRFLILTWLLVISVDAPAQVTRPHLFEVRKGEAVSWLFGTLHIGLEFEEVKSHLVEPLNNSRVIMLEMVNPVRSAARQKLWAEDPAAAVLTATDLDLQKGSPLSQTDRDYLASTFSIPSKLANRLRAGSCKAFFAFYFHMQPSIDNEIENFARQNKMVLRPLEDEKIRLAADRADGITPEDRNPTCNLMREAYDLANPSHTTGLEKIYKMYRTGEPLTPANSAGNILRNHAWMKTLVPTFTTGGAFASVGGSHLYGEQGLIELLRAEGFIVRQLPYGLEPLIQ